MLCTSTNLHQIKRYHIPAEEYTLLQETGHTYIPQGISHSEILLKKLNSNTNEELY